MPGIPEVVAFDVIETLFSLQPLRARFQAIGLRPELLELWFAMTPRDGFALAASDTFRPFREVASATLEGFLIGQDQQADRSAVGRVLEGFTELAPEPDVEPSFARLQERGARMITLSNGSRETTRTLLQKAGFERFIEQAVSIDEVNQWKPRREVYLHAAKVVGVAPAQLALVAAHAWDTHGAKRAGLITGWVQRHEKRYPATMEAPDVSGETLLQVCDGLLALSR